MVLEYAENDNLRKYLKTNFFSLTWKEKLDSLYIISYNLKIIHDQKYVKAKITDLGLLQLINNSKSSGSSNVCGVLPYVAPEENRIHLQVIFIVLACIIIIDLCRR